MDQRSAARLLEHLRATTAPLGSLAPGRIGPALDPALVAALSVDRATRDRLVIFDPLTAPYLRPLVVAGDLRPWWAGGAGRWLIAVPDTVAAGLAERHQALARHLAALTPPADIAASAEFWWGLRADAAVAPVAPRIIIGAGGAPCAWDTTAALVGGPATVVAAAEPYWLALLGSRVGAALLGVTEIATFPVPEAPGPARANLEGLALAAASLAAQRDELERAVLRRLVADFGPPGAVPGPALSRWWQLSFAELLAAVDAELRNPIPGRFQATWAEIHADQQATHADASARLDALQAAIDAQAAVVFGAA